MADFYPAVTVAESYDEALMRDIVPVILGVTGLPVGTVRPRWQTRTPNWPDTSVDWCSVGVVRETPTDYGESRYNDADEMEQRIHHVTTECLLSFYGPNASRYIMRARAGLQLSSNQDAIHEYGLAVLSIEGTTTLTEEINAQFVQRIDLPVTFRRGIRVDYAIPRIDVADGTISLTTPGIGALSVAWTVTEP